MNVSNAAVLYCSAFCFWYTNIPILLFVTHHIYYAILHYIFAILYCSAMCKYTKYYTQILICTNLKSYVLRASCISVITQISPPSFSFALISF